MMEKWQLERTKRWCQKLTLAHFSVVLDATQKAIMLNADGSKFADVPAKYQPATVELLRSGEKFMASPILPRQPEQSCRVESSNRVIVNKQIKNRFVYSSHVRPALSLIS